MLTVEIAKQVNFAFHQNSLPFLRQIEITNTGAVELRDIRLTLEASPAFLKPKSWHIELLAPGATLHLTSRDVTLDGSYLQSLEEKLLSTVTFSLRDSSGTLLAEQENSVEVLARNEWGGYGASPELLAAFSMPNDPAVDKILTQASKLLEASGQSSRLMNYQDGDASRLWMQASAVWSAVQSLALEYAYPPKSFERTGQKVRTPTMILDGRRATCLDTTMLFASLFEQMQLHPLVVIEDGHAYVGLWLLPEGFHRPYLEDEETLRKRLALKELILIETTLVTQGLSFTAALKHCEEKLRKSASAFVGVVDIARARDERIYPLSLNPSQSGETADLTTVPQITLAMPNPEDLPVPVEQSQPLTPAGRVELWQRKLLDLTLRNPLLNLPKHRKTTIPLFVPNPAQLEDALASGAAMAIDSQPDIRDRDTALHAERTGESLSLEMASRALRNHSIYALLEPKLLEGSLVELYRKSQSDLDEGGANTLFLAIGVLKWRRDDNRTRVLNAPLILIPVSLTRKSVRSGIKMTLNDDDPRFNTTLLELLRQDFALDIPGFEGPLPQDDAGVDVEGILNKIRHAIRDAEGFEVTPEVFLGRFSFAKYLLWQDLVARTDILKENPVVRHLIDSPQARYPPTGQVIAAADLDRALKPTDFFTPLAADSSQLSAVMASSKGADFVMIGPPGTGKSQTIANMISQNLAEGRRVLFVSEKAAALNVVFRRLQEHGLGDFCLELHSNKAKKLDVLAQLDKAWSQTQTNSQREWEQQAQTLAGLGIDLNDYVRHLHQRHGNGWSIRTGIAIAAGNAGVPRLPLTWSEVDCHSETDFRALYDLVERLEVNARNVGNLTDNPLTLVANDDWFMAWQASLVNRAELLETELKGMRAAFSEALDRLKLQAPPLTLSVVDALPTLFQALLTSSGKNLSFAFLPNARAIIDNLLAALPHLAFLQNLDHYPAAGYERDKALSADLGVIQQLLRDCREKWGPFKWWASYQCKSHLKNALAAKDSKAIDPEGDHDKLAILQDHLTKLKALAEPLSAVPEYRGVDSNIATLEDLIRTARALRQGIATLSDDPEQLPDTEPQSAPWCAKATKPWTRARPWAAPSTARWPATARRNARWWNFWRTRAPARTTTSSVTTRPRTRSILPCEG